MDKHLIADVPGTSSLSGLDSSVLAGRFAQHGAMALIALTVAICLLFTPIDDPWLALTMRGLAIASVLAFLLTPCRRWIVSGCLVLSLLLVTPSFFGEQSSVPGATLAIFAAVLSFIHQLGRRTRVERNSRGIVLAPLLLLCSYWALLAVGSESLAPVLLAYSLTFVAVAIVFQGDRDAVREALALLALFVAVLGFAWVFTIATYAILGLEPGRIPRSAYELRSNFSYATWGPLLITNSNNTFALFGLSRTTEIGGEPGTWALIAALGAASAGVVFSDRPQLRRFALTGGLVAILSSQSTGAIVSLAAATAATLAFWAARQAPSPESRHRFPVMLLLAGSFACTIPFLLQYLLIGKLSQDASVLNSRGLDFLGGNQSWGAGSRINLLSAIGVDGASALLPIVGLVLTVLVLRHNPFSFAFAVFFLQMGVLIQPVHWHVGIWFGCVLLATAVAPVGLGGTNPPPINWTLREEPPTREAA